MKPRRILVVDDEQDIRQSLSGVLEDEGYKTQSAESGEACLELLRNFSWKTCPFLALKPPNLLECADLVHRCAI